MTTLPPHAPQQRLDPEEWEAVRREATDDYPQADRLTQAANAPAAPIVTAEHVSRAIAWDPQWAAANTVAPLPPGMAVAHSLNTAAYITAATAIPAPNFHAVSWDRAPEPEYVGNTQSDFGRMLSRLFNGFVRSIGLTWHGGDYKRLTLEIDVPKDMSYETVVANLHKFAEEIAPPKQPFAASFVRRRLLKLENVS